MSDKALRVAILEYIRDLKGADESSREISLNCLQETFGISLDSAEAKSESLSAKGTSLAQVFAKGLNSSAATGAAAASKSKAPVDPVRAEEFKVEGNNFLKAGKYNEAIGSYTKAIELNHTSAVYWLNRAIAKINIGDHASALEDTESAIAQDVNYTKAYYRKGQCLASLERIEEAIAAFEDAERRASADPALLQNIRDQLRSTRALHATSNVLDSNPDAINEVASKLSQDQGFAKLAEDPEIREIMEDVSKNGMVAAFKHFQNPKVAAKLQPLMQSFLGGGGAGGMDMSALAGMFGGGK